MEQSISTKADICLLEYVRVSVNYELWRCDIYLSIISNQIRSCYQRSFFMEKNQVFAYAFDLVSEINISSRMLIKE